VKENFKGSSQNALFAVFDGHGGQQAADFCSSNLGEALERQPNLQLNTLFGVKKGMFFLTLTFLAFVALDD
jgi:serine/threonine protein phosphatase PrpC